MSSGDQFVPSGVARVWHDVRRCGPPSRRRTGERQPLPEPPDEATERGLWVPGERSAWGDEPGRGQGCKPAWSWAKTTWRASWSMPASIPCGAVRPGAGGQRRSSRSWSTLRTPAWPSTTTTEASLRRVVEKARRPGSRPRGPGVEAQPQRASGAIRRHGRSGEELASEARRWLTGGNNVSFAIDNGAGRTPATTRLPPPTTRMATPSPPPKPAAAAQPSPRGPPPTPTTPTATRSPAKTPAATPPPPATTLTTSPPWSPTPTATPPSPATTATATPPKPSHPSAWPPTTSPPLVAPPAAPPPKP